MRNSLILLFLPILQVFAISAYSQDNRLTLNFQNTSIEDVLNAIEDRSNYNFVYNYRLIDVSKKIDIRVENESLVNILTSIFSDSDVDYMVQDHQILLSPKEYITGSKSGLPPFVITGKVTDVYGIPLPGVNVIIKNTSRGSITNLEGVYSLEIEDTSQILVFSYLGYKTVEERVGDQNVINVSMVEDIQALEEVMVIGYGTVKKSDLTGSVSSVSVDELENNQLSSLEQLMQGRAAGVLITKTSSKPGGSISVKIRGNNSINAGNEPLYVIDGFPISSNEYELSSNMTSGGPINPLATLNPNDIESIEILKDASATAIYGARATNGVVLITTKRGKSGEGKIHLNYSAGIQQIRKKLDLLNAIQFAELVNEARENEGLTPEYTDLDSLGEGTDWQDELFRTAVSNDLNISFSGGRENLRYFLSTNYFNQEGIIHNTDLNRIAIRSGIDMDVKSWLLLTANLNVSNVQSNNIETSEWGVVNTALMFNPMLPVKDDEGNYTLMNDRTIFTGNPVALAKEADSKSNTTRVITNLAFDFKILNGLHFKSTVGVDAGFNKEYFYYPSYILAGYDSNGNGGIGNLYNYSLLNENTLNYVREINANHVVNVLLGVTAQTSRNEVNRVAVEGFSEDILKYNGLNAASDISSFPFSYVSRWSMLSYLGRINYNLYNKYLVSLNARYDGSSKFGADNKYGFFPSFALAWKISEEEFMSNFERMNQLKVRVSYGVTGNQDIAGYQSLAVLGVTSYPIETNKIVGYKPIQIANPDLKWETTKQFNAGVDISFFESRIQITSDYYYKYTNDLLLYVNLPISSGFTTALQNIGEVKNQGFEFGFSSRNLVGGISWTTDFNIALNRNEVVDLAGEESMSIPSRINQLDPGWLVVGKPIGLFYGLKTDGLFQSDEEIAESAQPGAKPGDIKYIDYNNDGMINMDDRQLIGMTEPKFFGGITNTFSYKGFDLIVFLQGTFGNDIWNGNLLSHEYPNGLYNQFTTVLDRWTPENPDASVPRASAFMQDAFEMDRFVEDGSYLRVKTITISYDLQNIIKVNRVEALKLYFTAENLFTWTNYTGYDPEVSYFGKNYLVSGYDWGSYPSTKNYYFGIKFSF